MDSEILDLKDYGPQSFRGYRYVLIVIDNSSEFGWTVALKSENVQTITNSFEKILKSSKRKPNLKEIADG